MMTFCFLFFPPNQINKNLLFICVYVRLPFITVFFPFIFFRQSILPLLLYWQVLWWCGGKLGAHLPNPLTLFLCMRMHGEKRELVFINTVCPEDTYEKRLYINICNSEAKPKHANKCKRICLKSRLYLEAPLYIFFSSD